MTMHEQIITERQRLMNGFEFFISDNLPHPEQLLWCKGMWKLGTGAATNRKEKIRFLKQSELMMIDPIPMTYTDVNFTYLKFHAHIYPSARNRLSAKQIQYFNTHRATTPAFAVPFEGEAIYFDLKAFHANVLIAFGRDMDYFPNAYIEPQPNHEDYPYWNNKEARNRLHSTAYGGGHLLTVKDGEVRDIELPTYWANPALIAFTHDLSMMIAHMMVNEGKAIYANRDGYIVPRAWSADATRTLKHIGIPFAIKQYGHCNVRHFGDYDFDPSVFGSGHESKRKGHSFASHPLPAINIDKLYQLTYPHILAAKDTMLYPKYTDEQQNALAALGL